MSREVSSDLLTASIIAYVGFGSRRTPGADEGAVLALDPVGGARTLEVVKRIVRMSDSLHIPEEAFGDRSRSILFGEEFEKLWPGLTPEALYALSWRWSYNEFF
jgi:hypothetical protein